MKIKWFEFNWSSFVRLYADKFERKEDDLR
jgi:hypothetical protein